MRMASFDGPERFSCVDALVPCEPVRPDSLVLLPTNAAGPLEMCVEKSLK